MWETWWEKKYSDAPAKTRSPLPKNSENWTWGDMIIGEKGGEEKDCGGGHGGSQKASLNSAFILSSSWTAHVQNRLRIALLRTNNMSWTWRRCRRNWDVCSSTVEKKKKKNSECQKLKELLKMEQGGHYPSSTLHRSRCCLDIDPSSLYPLTQSLWNHTKYQSQRWPKTQDVRGICMPRGSQELFHMEIFTLKSKHIRNGNVWVTSKVLTLKILLLFTTRDMTDWQIKW